jgi:hypothetical protein
VEYLRSVIHESVAELFVVFIVTLVDQLVGIAVLILLFELLCRELGRLLAGTSLETIVPLD